MRYIIFFSFLLISSFTAFAQVPANDECVDAIEIIDARNYCSGSAQFNNINASPTFTGTGNDVFFKFTARNFEVKVTVSGSPHDGSIQSPSIKLYNGCGGSLRTVQTVEDGNTTIISGAGLIPGLTYYIGISGANNNTGTFKLCIENYQSEIKAGQDFAGASSTLICSTESMIREVNISGAGLNPNEALGTCLDVQPGNTFSETNSAWYKWIAANDGTLVFTITPNKRDDIDWVLYELGPESTPQVPSSLNAIRCAAGEGITQRCPTEATYVLTGLDFNSTDQNESAGCGQGQDGFVQFITMKKGYVYALLVNNASASNNGFEIAFTDNTGKPGTGLFKGPSAEIKKVDNNLCSANPSYTFSSVATNFDTIQWYFGEGASTAYSLQQNPGEISYNTSGLKTVVLEVKTKEGCTIVKTESFMHVIKPDPPIISINKPNFCLNDVISLSTPAQNDVIYHWTGPNNFSSSLQSPEIPVSSEAVAGTYTLILSRENCSTQAVSVLVPPIYKTPVAAFRAEPKPPVKLSFPIRVRFYNESKDADAYLWDFGDKITSTDKDPEHIYLSTGDFDVSLTVFKNSTCSTTVAHGKFMIGADNILFIPNTFTPNNDALNDEFVVSMTNIKKYKIQIFNRLGVPVFVSHDLFKHWKGTYNNEPVPVGTYYYFIDASDFNDQIIKKSGSITVIR